MTPTMSDDRPDALLSAPETRRFLNDFVKRRVNASDADDVVQTVLCDALQAARIPDTNTEMRRWLTGIARHKIADLHRKAGREQPSELPDIESPPAPVEERQMAEWAEEQAKQSKDAERTLRWMAREGEGEKLEQIAAEEKVEAATVRQRVSRMRRWMKERWLAELAAVAMLALAGFFVWRWLKTPSVEVVPEPIASGTPNKSPIERAVALRRGALEACKRAEFGPCLEQLDRAKELDPAGDSSPEVNEARQGAKKALETEKQGPSKVPQTNDGPTSDGPTSDGPTDNGPNNNNTLDKKGLDNQAPSLKSDGSIKGQKGPVPAPSAVPPNGQSTPTGTPSKTGPPSSKPSAPSKKKSLSSDPSGNFGSLDSSPGKPKAAPQANAAPQPQPPQPQAPQPQAPQPAQQAPEPQPQQQAQGSFSSSKK